MVGQAATPTGLWLPSWLADATPLGLCRIPSVVPGLLVPRNPGLEGAILSGLGEIGSARVLRALVGVSPTI